MSSNQNELHIEIYTFQDYNIRVSGTFEKPQFAAKDITNILGLTNVSEALSNVPDKWKGYQRFLTPKGDQDMLALHEPGVYKLVMRSNKPVAEKFQEWICEEVIPSIRKKGEYVLEEYKKKLEDQQKLLEKKDEHIRKLQREKQFVEGKKVVYLCTAEGQEEQGIYTVGQTIDVEDRLKEYNDNKFINFKTVKQVSCKSFKLMDAIETIMLAKLNKYKIYKNRDVFQLPEGKDLSFFTQWYDYIAKFCDDIEEDIVLEERTDEEKQKMVEERRKAKSKEYREENKEQISEKLKKYYEENKEIYSEKHKKYYEENKEKIIESVRVYSKENKSKISKNKKKYAEENKEKIAEKMKKYYEENKEKISINQKEKINCECGLIITKSNIQRHQKSKIHNNFLSLV